MEFSIPPVDVSQPPPMQQPPPTMQPPPSMQQTTPPVTPNYTSFPPPPHGTHGPPIGGHHRTHYFPHHSGAGKPGHPYFKPFGGFNRGHGGFGMTQDDFDGKRLRKSVMRKTVDYNASIVKAIETRLWQRDFRDRHALQPESIYVPDLLPPPSYLDNPSNAVTTRFVKTATNKMRCPIFTLAWTPEGRRLVTGASSGEFTLWNGLTFNFETILQAHDVPVRTMVWSHNDSWMVTGDHSGYVKYWQSNMNNVKMFQAHKEPIRGISFSPSDNKFVSCSDDGTLRVWDFFRCHEERVLRGHGADVKCVHWHPHKGLIVSGSKDNQQPIKLWDPKSGLALATLHAHKSTVMDLKWNDNGNWLVTASRDHLLKLFDLRNLREEIQVFRGHKKEASSVSWHPVHEGLFSSGGSDGSILFWNVGTDKEIGGIEAAHDSIVWTLAWHPLGHILCSGSNDHTIKFWTRNRPGDLMRDKYNLNTLPASLAALDECEYDDAVIPGMGPEDKVEFTESLTADKGFIPGLDLDPNKLNDKDKEKKVPYSKPIPRNFQAQWNDSRRADEGHDEQQYNNMRDIKDVQLLHHNIGEMNSMDTLGGGLDGMDVNAVAGIAVYGRLIRVLPDSQLDTVVRHGPDALNKYINSGKIDELRDIIPFCEERSRSRSPTTQDPSGKSPPPKKSRFEPRNHNAQIVYVRDLIDQRQTNSQKTFIPSLLGLKVPQPGDGDPLLQPKMSPQDQDFRRFKTEDNNQNRPSPWASGFQPTNNNNDNNRRLNPWASSPVGLNNNNLNGFSGPTLSGGNSSGPQQFNHHNPFSSMASSFGPGGNGAIGNSNSEEFFNQDNENDDNMSGVSGGPNDMFDNNTDGGNNSGVQRNTRGKGSRFTDKSDGDFSGGGGDNRRGGKPRNRDGGRRDNRRQNRNRNSRRF